MFLWQKLGYSLNFLESEEDFKKIDYSGKEVIAFDTESTGLHIMKSLPFLVGFGFGKDIYIYEPSLEKNSLFFNIAKESKYCLAHNAKFDYHMMYNFGSKIPKEVNIADTYALGRITDYVDSMEGLSLEALGTKLVHQDSKVGKKIISEHINQINARRLKSIREWIKSLDTNFSYSSFMTAYKKRVNYVEHEWDEYFNEMERIFPEVNYEDSYKEKPNLMKNYLADDVVLVLEIFKRLEDVLDVVDRDRKTWHRENKLIRVVGDMERNGMPADIDYLLKSRSDLMKYKDVLYRGLQKHTGEDWSSGQHKKIAHYFANRHGIYLSSTDFDSLESVCKSPSNAKLPKKVAKLIVDLRTVDKWLSTYVEGMLNRIENGRVYSDINNSGTNTGRVSGDMQQQPKYPLKTRWGREIFHPRKVFINEEGHTNFYIDFSNMELRVQAQYTIFTSGGDFAMCRAFMPFQCKNVLTGEIYTPLRDKDTWNSGLWVDENGEPWQALDLHTETTKKAFPEVSESHPDFKNYYRDLGKRANFTKNYGGGKRALIDNLGVDEETASKLNNGYYEAFPKVLEYQSWVDKQIRTYGFIENLFGRRYYFNDTSYSYRGYNYLIQGSCADYVKLKEIQLSEILEDYASKMIMPIHDEIIFSIKHGEEHIIPVIKQVLEDANIMMPHVPMVADVSYTDSSWANKKGYNL